ncbi:BTAD domain-containing putative transcriptional regulator [Kitasatospora aureofaciens]|uniref:BTAD domain-containing putative transcriptional regulator n=1 Tax=Kitasatospora aureofaciens TaxID=1894 RepID=UPI0036F4B00E
MSRVDNAATELVLWTPAPIRVLGQMSVQVGRQRLDLGPPRQRALLALLLINAGRVVSVSAIVNAIWGSSPPQAVVGTLQSYVSRLRKAIDSQAPVPPKDRLLALSYQAPGYVLEVDRNCIDASRFQSAVESGREQFARGDLAAARSTVDDALGLWHGTPYGELAAYDFAQLETARLEQLRLVGLQTWADACLGLARYDEVVRELDDEVRRNPMLEHLGCRLMRAQYHCGQPAEALLTFERIRAHLAEELGADTSRELQELHGAILRQDLAHAGGPAASSVTLRPRLTLVADVDALRPPDPATPEPTPDPAADPAPEPTPDPAADPAPEPTPVPEPPHPAPVPAPAAPAPAPAPAGHLVGRTRELDALRALTGPGRRGRTVLVIGEQGVGKTRLLQELASGLPAAGMDAVWAHCAAGPELPDYWLWTRVVRKLRRTRAHELGSLPEAVLDILDLLRPDRTPGPAGAEAPLSPARHLAFQDAVCQALLTAARRPLVLFLEDLHLADTGTLALLQLLTKEIHDTDLLVVATVREHRLALRPELGRAVADLLQEVAAESLHLDALSLAETRTLINLAGGEPPTWDLVSAAHRATGGNPYLLTKLQPSAGPVADPVADPAGPAAPISFDLRLVLRARLAECPGGVTRVLQACAVIGPTVDRRLLTDVLAGLGEPPGLISEALHTGLLSPDPVDPHGFRFAQGLVRSMLLADLDPVHRARLHHRVATALADRAVGTARTDCAGTIGYHCGRAAQELDLREAVRPLVGLGDLAERRLLHAEAYAWLSHAIDVLREQPQTRSVAAELELQKRVVWLLSMTLGYGAPAVTEACTRVEVLQRALDNTRPPALLASRVIMHLAKGDHPKVSGLVALLDESAEHGGTEARTAACYGRGVLWFTADRLEEAVAELERGLPLVDAQGEEERPDRFMGLSRSDPRINYRVHLAVGHVLLGDAATAERYREEILQFSESDSCDRPWDRTFALYADALLAVLDGDVERAWQASTAGVDLTVRCQLSHWQYMLAVLLGWAEVHRGRPRTGLRRMRWALDSAARSGTVFRRALHLGLLAEAEQYAGMPDLARATVRTMADEIERRGEYVLRRPQWPFAALLAGAG